MKLIEPIVITGATGFIGANLVRELLEKNYTVHILHRRGANMWRLGNLNKDISLHVVDLLEKNSLDSILNKLKPKTIFHFASYGNSSVHTDAKKILDTNIFGTFYLLEAIKKLNIAAFVYAGSSSEYGYKKTPMSETNLLEPSSFYGIAKSTATSLCQLYSTLYKMPIISLRFFSVYGPYEENRRFIPTIIKQLRESKPISLTSLVARHDFIYVEDVVIACIKAATLAPKYKGEIINVGTGQEYTNQEVVEHLFSIMGKTTRLIKGEYPDRTWDTSHWVANTRKMNTLLDYTSQYSLERGLKKTYDWFDQNYKFYDEK